MTASRTYEDRKRAAAEFVGRLFVARPPVSSVSVYLDPEGFVVGFSGTVAVILEGHEMDLIDFMAALKARKCDDTRKGALCPMWGNLTRERPERLVCYAYMAEEAD